MREMICSAYSVFTVTLSVSAFCLKPEPGMVGQKLFVSLLINIACVLLSQPSKFIIGLNLRCAKGIFVLLFFYLYWPMINFLTNLVGSTNKKPYKSHYNPDQTVLLKILILDWEEPYE